MNALLSESLEWVRSHPGALNTDVPAELLDAWLGDDLGSPGMDFAVFAAGTLCQIARGEPHDTNIILVGEVPRMYGLWQWKLAAAKISRCTRVQIDPMPLFVYDLDTAATSAQLAPE